MIYTINDLLIDETLPSLYYNMPRYLNSKIVYDFQDNLCLSNIIENINLYSNNDVQRIFIAYVIYDYLKKYYKPSFIKQYIKSIKSNISFKVYMILSALVFNKIWHYNHIKDIINEITLQDIPVFNFILKYLYKFSDKPVIYKILSLYFNTQELNIIYKYFSLKSFKKYYKNRLNYFGSFNEDIMNIKQMRQDIIKMLFSIQYDKSYITNHKKAIMSFKQYFELELIDSQYFIYACCKHKLLTQDFISQAVDIDKRYLNIFDWYATQYRDYINSLKLLQKLGGCI